jgi:hypothetical protein
MFLFVLFAGTALLVRAQDGAAISRHEGHARGRFSCLRDGWDRRVRRC